MERNPLLLAALNYAAQLGPVFPLFTPRQTDQGDWVCDCPDTYKADGRCAPGKHPRTSKGSDAATTDVAQITRWWTIWPHANIGLHLGRAELITVGPDSVGWLVEFQQRGLPPTFTFASSGPGHMHHLYRRPAWVPITRICKKHEYDVLSNGYVVMPPSLHISGERYLLADDRAPTEPPAWACEMLGEFANRPKGQGIPLGDNVAQGEDLERIIERIDPAIWNGVRFDDRSTSLVAIAGDAAKAGANVETIYAIVRERDESLGFNKYLNRSPESADRAYTGLAQAAYARNPPDVHVSGNGSAKIGSPDPTGNGNRSSGQVVDLEWLTAKDMLDLEIEEIVWYSEGLLGEGILTEIDGYAKQAGKTTFALAMVARLLESEPFIDRPTSYSPVVYLAEQSKQSFRRTLERSGLLGREDFHILIWHSARGRKWTDIIKAAIARCKEVGARILIIDTLAQWVGMKGDDENSAGQMSLMMRPVQEATQDDLAVLLLRHDKKAGGEVGKSARGSSFAAGAVDIIVQLRRLDARVAGASRNQRVLESESRFEETPQELVIELRDGPPVHYVVASHGVEQLRNEARIMQILAVLPMAEGDAMSTQDIVESTSIRRADLLGTLNLMVERGYIQRKRVGKASHYWQDPVEPNDE